MDVVLFKVLFFEIFTCVYIECLFILYLVKLYIPLPKLVSVSKIRYESHFVFLT